MRTYACQVHLVHLLLDVLLGCVESRNCRVVIAGTSGFRLGQAGSIGHCVGPLRSRDVHIPLISASIGAHAILETDSLESATALIGECPDDQVMLEQWEQQTDDARIAVQSDRSVTNVTTSDWFFVRDQDSSQHLYSKPDDIDDFNDVARVRADIVADLDCQ